MLSKLASGSQKPDGLVQVNYKDRLQFLDSHPLWHICGIASRTQKRLNRLGIYTVKHLRQAPKSTLVKEFGILGEVYWFWGHGQDFSPVSYAGEVDPDKSYGNQMTLPYPTHNKPETFKVILWLCWQVAHRLRDHKTAAKTASLYLRRGDAAAHAQASTNYIATPQELFRLTKYIYYQKLHWQGPIKFASVSVSNLIPNSPSTLPIFDTQAKHQKIAGAWDLIAEKYGAFHLRPASLIDKNLKQTNLNGFTKKF
jgi:nucleotidyltransferase/DNA polymerase involved in DNA repair